MTPECIELDVAAAEYTADDPGRFSVRLMEEPDQYACRLALVELVMGGSFTSASGATLELESNRVVFEGYFPSAYAGDCGY